MIFKKLSPRDILSLCQSSSAAGKWYYSSVPQFGDLKVRRSESSVPCCGSSYKLDTGVCRSSCYTWKHRECAGLASLSSNKRYLCPDCHEGKNCSSLVPGGIAQTTGRRPETLGYHLGGHPDSHLDSHVWCQVKVNGCPKVLEQRLHSSTRPLLGVLPAYAIDFAIYFGSAFSGLAYGLEDLS